MRAVVYDRYGAPDVLRLEEVDRPEPADDQVLVKVHRVQGGLDIQVGLIRAGYVHVRQADYVLQRNHILRPGHVIQPGFVQVDLTVRTGGAGQVCGVQLGSFPQRPGRIRGAGAVGAHLARAGPAGLGVTRPAGRLAALAAGCGFRVLPGACRGSGRAAPAALAARRRGLSVRCIRRQIRVHQGDRGVRP